MLRWTLSLLAMLLPGGIGWLLLSPAAPPLLWRAAQLLPGELRVAQSEGPLVGSLSLRGIDYRLDDRHITINRLSWDLSLFALLRGELRFDALLLDGVHIDRPASSTGESTLPSLVLPLPIELRQGQLTDLQIRSGNGPALIIDRIALAAAAAGSHITLHALTIEQAQWIARLSGDVSLQDKIPLQLQGSLQGSWRGEPLTLNASLKGTLNEALIFAAESTTPARLRIEGTARPATAGFNWQAEVELTALPGRLFGQPALNLSGKALLQSEGPRVAIGLALTLLGLPVEPVQLQAKAHLDGDLLDLEQARLSWSEEKSGLDLHGRVTSLWTANRQIDLTGGWRNLDWPLVEPRLSSPAGYFSLRGELSRYEAALSAQMNIASIGDSRWQLRLQGDQQRLEVTEFSGELLQGRFDGSGTIDLTEQRFLSQIELQQLDLTPLLRQAVTGSGSLTLSGDYGGLRFKLVDGSIDHAGRHHRLLADGAWRGEQLQIDQLRLEGPGSHLQLQGQLGEQLRLDFSARFDDLGLWLDDAGGTLSLQGELRGVRSAPRLRLDGKGSRLRHGDWSVQSAETRLLLDLTATAPSSVELKLGDLRGLNRHWSLLRLQGQGNIADHHLRLELREGDSERLLLTARAGYRDQQWRAEVDDLRIVTLLPPSSWKLSQPFRFTLGTEALALEQACLLSQRDERGCLALKGRFGGFFELAAEVENIDLAPWAALLNPDLALTGTATGELRGRLSTEHLDRLDGGLRLSPGQFNWSGNQAGMAEASRWAHQGGEIKLSTGREGLSATAQLQISATEAVSAEAQLNPATAAPWRFDRLVDSPLTGRASANLGSLSWIEGVMPEVSILSGELDLAAQLSGTAAAPSLSGALQLHQGRFEVPRYGLRMADLTLALTLLDGGDFRLDGSARAGGLLTLAGSGRYHNPWRLDAHVSGSDLLLADLPEAKVEISPDLQLALQPGQAKLTGTVAVPRARIQLRKRTPTVPASGDVVIVGQQQATQASRWQIDSDVLVNLSDQVQFKGYGFDGTIGGQLRVVDSSNNLAYGSGELRVSKGSYDAYGKLLNIERGRLIFAHTPLDDPAIDLLATRRYGELTVGVQGRGTAQQPRITLYSSEAMAQSDILSWLVVGKPLAQVGQGESNLLMNAASSAFLQGGERLSQWIGQRFGIGDVSIKQDDFSQQPWLMVGTQLSPRLYLSYYFGLVAGDNKLRLRYQLGRSWSLQGESGAASGADILYSPK